MVESAVYQMLKHRTTTIDVQDQLEISLTAHFESPTSKSSKPVRSQRIRSYEVSKYEVGEHLATNHLKQKSAGVSWAVFQQHYLREKS
jgi:hypothetical protein